LPSLPEDKPKPASTGAQEPVEISLVIAHMAGSIGQQKAEEVVFATLTSLRLPTTGALKDEDLNTLIDMVGKQPGLVGLAAKVTKQMLRLHIQPLKPAF
jgi:hypothetical protein